MPFATHPPFRFGLTVLALVGTLAFALPAAAASDTRSADLLGCDEIVHDPDGLLDDVELEPLIERAAATLGADVRIRGEPSLDGGLDERIDQLRRQCDGWDNGDGELADDMVVVLFSVAERENSIFYGAAQGPALENRWNAATDAMIPHLRSGDYTGAVDAALVGITSDPVASSSGSGSGTNDDDDDSNGSNGGVILAVIVLVAVAGIGVISKLRRVATGEEGRLEGSDDDVDSDERGWFSSGSSRQRRSSFGFGSSSRRSSRSSSGRSSSRGSRRSGGGTKKW